MDEQTNIPVEPTVEPTAPEAPADLPTEPVSEDEAALEPNAE